MKLNQEGLLALAEEIKKHGYGLVWVIKDNFSQVSEMHHLPIANVISQPHNSGDPWPWGHYRYFKDVTKGVVTLVDARDVIKVKVDVTLDRVKEAITKGLTDMGVKS